jgi:hypothetical protein
LVLNLDGSFSCAATLNCSGADLFTYHATDTISDSNVATAMLTVAPVWDIYMPPVMRSS